MYKKITHNIIEEHFDHPMANKIKSSLDKRSGIPTAFVFNEEPFRNAMNSRVNTYANKLVALLNSVTGTEDDLITAFENLFNGIDDIGSMFKHFYPSELAERINVSMRGMGLLFTIMVHFVKSGRDSSVQETRLGSIANDMGINMNLYNSRWDGNEIRTLFTNIVSSATTKLNSRFNKNTSAEQQAESAMRAYFSNFSDMVQNGIISQYPARFVQEDGITL